jgi:hypothetical protein
MSVTVSISVLGRSQGLSLHSGCRKVDFCAMDCTQCVFSTMEVAKSISAFWVAHGRFLDYRGHKCDFCLEGVTMSISVLCLSRREFLHYVGRSVDLCARQVTGPISALWMSQGRFLYYLITGSISARCRSGFTVWTPGRFGQHWP